MYCKVIGTLASAGLLAAACFLAATGMELVWAAGTIYMRTGDDTILRYQKLGLVWLFCAMACVIAAFIVLRRCFRTHESLSGSKASKPSLNSSK